MNTRGTVHNPFEQGRRMLRKRFNMAARIILIVILVDIFCYSNATECGGSLRATTSVQNITSPNYPAEYPNNVTCRWTISPSEPNMDVRIVININLEIADESPKCQYDSLQIFKGSEHSGSRLEYLCGLLIKPIQTSGDSIITVILTTDLNLSKKRGMHLQVYQTSEPLPCQQVVESTTTKAYIYSENYPHTYESNTICTWLFRQQDRFQRHHILRFLEYQQAHWNCDEQYVEIYNGVSEGARSLGKYCGTGNPDFIGSGSLFVKLVTGPYPTGKGLKIQHFLTRNTIQRNVYPSPGPDELGTITSPNYPNFLPSYLTYNILISYFQGGGYVINVNFITSNVGSNYGCFTSKVSVYDGQYSTSSRHLGTMCGNQYNRTFTSTKLAMLIKMTTGSYVMGDGYDMTYRVIRQTSTTMAQTTTTSTQRPLTCSSSRLYKAYTSWRYLTSPGYPHAYGPSMDCKWTITTTDYYTMVRVVVIHSELEFDSDCQYDKVTAYDGSNTFSKILMVWCGTMTPTVQSTGNQMTLRFQTDPGSQLKGFRLKFSQVSDPPSCDETLKATSNPRELTSPGYPYLYPPNLGCHWIIYTSEKHNVIMISVHDSRLEWTAPCTDDYVTVHDGKLLSADYELGKFCGTETPTYYSTGSMATISFYTDGSSNYKGFKLTYKSTNALVPATSSGSKMNVGGIVGGVVTATVVLVVVIAVVVSCSVRKRRDTRRTPTTTAPPYPQVVNTTNNAASAPGIRYSGSTFQSPGNFHYHPQTNAYNNPAYSSLSVENLYDKYGSPPAYDTLNFDTPYAYATGAGVLTQGAGVGTQGADVGTQGVVDYAGAGIQRAGAETQNAEAGSAAPVSNHQLQTIS